jgi:hypothetical protein
MIGLQINNAALNKSINDSNSETDMTKPAMTGPMNIPIE